jgi:glycerate-2-kinase
MIDAGRTAEEIFRRAVAAADPYRAVREQCDEVRGVYREGGFRRLLVLGGGKGAIPMARAVEDGLGDLVTAGLVVTVAGQPPAGLTTIRVREGGHPLPDAAGLAATAEILHLADAADGETLVLCLLSGGGSALLVAPAAGITLADKVRTTDLMMRAGADIRSLNTVRKHLSAIKGGGLGARLRPATTVSLILSDVIADPLDVIASGPTVPDPTTFADALTVLERYAVADRVPVAVHARLAQGAAGLLAETPKPGDPAFQRVTNRIVGSNRTALAAARTAAEGLGLAVEVDPEPVTGEAREAGERLARRALALRESRGTEGAPVCLLSGGETTVTVTGAGRGGRNQEFALAFALEIAGVPGITLLSAGTDGIDGPTPAAGAIVDAATIPRALACGLDPQAFLANNDAYTFFKNAGGLLVTGPTGTNVMDLQIVLIR